MKSYSWLWSNRQFLGARIVTDNVATVEDHMFKNILTTQVDLDGLKKKKAHKAGWVWKRGWWVWEDFGVKTIKGQKQKYLCEEWISYTQNTVGTLGTLQKVYKSYHISAKAWDFDCVPLLLTCERKVLCFQNTMMGTNRMHTLFSSKKPRGRAGRF